MRSREEVLKEFGTASCVSGDECEEYECVAIRNMADRIRTLEATPARVTEALQFVEEVAQGEFNSLESAADRAREISALTGGTTDAA
jgi:hypothetical protein